MKPRNSAVGNAGFTLIEVLVTLILISILVAAVFPVVTQQVAQANAPRLASDLSSIRTGIQEYVVNTKNNYPESIANLTTNPGAPTVVNNNWDGPYVDFSIAAGLPLASTATVSGFGAGITNQFYCATSTVTGSAPVAGACTSPYTNKFVALEITGLADEADIQRLKRTIDGEGLTDLEQGKLRCVVSGAGCAGNLYYLALPRK